MRFKARYGLLFNGYKHELSYWEITVMLRKVGIVAVCQFAATYSPEVQVLVLLVLFSMGVSSARNYPPFRVAQLSRLELYSLFANLLFIYNGLFIVIGSHHDYLKDSAFLRVLFLLLHVVPTFGYQIYCVKLMWE